MTEKGTQPYQNPEIRLDIQPLTLDVSVFLTGGGRSGSGKATLTLTETGMYLQPVSKGSMLNRLEPLGVLWGDVRELRSRKKQYVANVGVGRADTGRDDIILRFTLTGKSRERIDRLQDVLNRLPALASARRCPICSGPVVKDICQNCGKSFSLYQRKKGLKYLFAGVLFSVAGISIAASSAKGSEGGVLAVLLGAVFIIFGLIRLLFGTRTG